MRYITTSLLTLLIFLSSILTIPFNGIEEAFSTGNASKIVAFGGPKMIISIEGTEGVYSKSQGEQILSNFFKNNPPESFEFKFKGKDEGTSSFAVGVYQSQKRYRVSFKFKKSGKLHLVESITIAESTRRKKE